MATTQLTIRTVRLWKKLRLAINNLITRMDTLDGGGLFLPAGTETKTSGALSLLVGLSKLSIDGTKAFTLAAPTLTNEVKALYCTVATNTPAGTVTVTSMLGGTTLAFNAVDDCVILREVNGKWAIMYNNSVTVA